MVQNIMRNVFFSLAEIRAGDGDRPAGGLDLLDTLKAHAHECDHLDGIII